MLVGAFAAAAFLTFAPTATVEMMPPFPLRMRLRSASQSLQMIEMGEAEGELPAGVASRLSFQTGGYKTANQDEEILILWNTFKQCYPSEEAAIAALEKNTAVIAPQINSPTKIMGAYDLLVERFGEGGVVEIITKNPGILACTPESLSTQSNDDITAGAALVVTLEENKGAIKAFIGVSFISFPLLVGWQAGRNKGLW